MKRLELIDDVLDARDRKTSKSLPVCDLALLSKHLPDAHWVSLNDDDCIDGRISLWWTKGLHLDGKSVGIVGHYAAQDFESGARLLECAFGELKARGCAIAIGPMDGNTWRSYRFVTDWGNLPPFFLEPNHPPEWPDHFTAVGFRPLAYYFSSIDENLEWDDDRNAEVAAQRMVAQGVKLRSLDMSRYVEELRSLYRLISKSFRAGFLFQSISEDEFVAEYQEIRPWIRPELVTIAMFENRPIGLIFTLLDRHQKRTGQLPDTAIIKTLAIDPDRRFAGLGSYLVAMNRRVVRSLGCRRLIHALMHESNRSRSISARYGVPFRRYTLFSKSL